jgi:uncharacterized protein (DUF934 family)
MKRLELSPRAASLAEPVPFAELGAYPEARGVILTPEIGFEAIEPFLARLELVVVTFPAFRDGRGFTQARSIREYGKFAGEIRAEGRVLPDQANHLHRCGFDSVILPDEADETLWRKELHRFHTVYQTSVLERPGSPLRHEIP